MLNTDNKHIKARQNNKFIIFSIFSLVFLMTAAHYLSGYYFGQLAIDQLYSKIPTSQLVLQKPENQWRAIDSTPDAAQQALHRLGSPISQEILYWDWQLTSNADPAGTEITMAGSPQIELMLKVKYPNGETLQKFHFALLSLAQTQPDSLRQIYVTQLDQMPALIEW